MDSKRIDLLLERYWNCVSTQEEEAEIKAYFNSKVEIPAHLKSTAPLFQYFTKEGEVKMLDKAFDHDLIEKLKQQPKKGKERTLGQSFQNYMKVAAVIALVIATSFVFRMEIWQDDKPELFLVEDTFKTPEEAYAETKRALMLIASKMNHGKREVKKISILSKAESKIKGNRDKNSTATLN
ncbi:MAG: hypothetical protein L3J29_11490 [Cyclobacteriaceae bacterium]|nr:hypothetical protein [Cyclobacteriaceae bacterium]